MEWTAMATAEQTFPVARPRYTGILEWITTVDHKKIGVLYLFTTFFFFLSGGLLALAIRTQLATPDGTVLTAQQYNAAFTMHGTTMVFLFVVPVWTGFANFIIPLQLGARDMAFPRLNALSYWLLLSAGSSSTRASSSARPRRVGRRMYRYPRSRSRPVSDRTCGSSA